MEQHYVMKFYVRLNKMKTETLSCYCGRHLERTLYMNPCSDNDTGHLKVVKNWQNCNRMMGSQKC